MSDKVKELLAMLQQRREETAALKELYAELFTGEVPDDGQFHIWLRMYGFDEVAEALQDTRQKFNQFYQKAEELIAQGKTPPAKLIKSKTHIVRYASGCMKRSKQRAEGTFVETEPDADTDTEAAADSFEMEGDE
jgi:hypothetical protein